MALGSEVSVGRWRLPLAVFLSFLVIVFWGYLQRPLREESGKSSSSVIAEREEQAQEQEQAQAQEETVKPLIDEGAEEGSVEQDGSMFSLQQDEKSALAGGRYVLKNGYIEVEILEVGGMVGEVLIGDGGDDDTVSLWVGGDSFLRYGVGEVSFYPVTVRGVPPDRVRYKGVPGDDMRTVNLLAEVSLGDYKLRLLKTYVLGKEYDLEMTLTLEVLETGDRSVLRGSYYIFNGGDLGPESLAMFSGGREDLFNVLRVSSYRDGDLKKVLNKGFLSMFGTPKEREILMGGGDWLAIDNRFYYRLLQPKDRGEEFLFYRLLSMERTLRAVLLRGSP